MTSERDVDQKGQADRENVGVILVHGLGDCAPGEIITETTELPSTTAGSDARGPVLDNEPGVDLDGATQLHKWADNPRVETEATADLRVLEGPDKQDPRSHIYHERTARVDDAVNVTFGEVFWSDLKKDSRFGVPAILRFVAVVLKGHYIISAMFRERMSWASYPAIWMISFLSWLLRAPILGLNAVFGALFVALHARLVLYCDRIPDGSTIDEANEAIKGYYGAEQIGDPLKYSEFISGSCPGLRNGGALLYGSSAWFIAPLIAVFLLGVTLAWTQWRTRSFWRDASINIAVTAAIVFGLFLFWSNQSDLWTSQDADLSDFFSYGMTLIFALWLALPTLFVIAAVLTLALSVLYLLTRRLRTESRRLSLGLGIVAIQAMLWGLITRPLWISGGSSVHLLTDLTFGWRRDEEAGEDAIPSILGLPMDEGEIHWVTIATAIDQAAENILTVSFVLLAMGVLVILIFIALVLIARTIRRLLAWRIAPRSVWCYPRVVFNAFALRVIAVSYVALSIAAIAVTSTESAARAVEEILGSAIEDIRKTERSLTNDAESGPEIIIDERERGYEDQGGGKDIVESAKSQGQIAERYAGRRAQLEALRRNVAQYSDLIETSYSNIINPLVQLLLLFSVPLLIVCNRQISYAAFVLEDIANYARGRKDRTLLLAHASGAETRFERLELWRQISRRLQHVSDHLLGDEHRLNRCIIVAHSQGAVVLYDNLERLTMECRDKGIPLEIITLGSPLEHIYSRYFPEYMDIEERVGRLAAIKGPDSQPVIRSWTNMYRANEAIGRWIIAHGAEAPIREIALPPGPHKGYWYDTEVRAMLLSKIRGEAAAATPP